MKAYPSEPMPLKRAYPNDSTKGLEIALQILGMAIAIGILLLPYQHRAASFLGSPRSMILAMSWMAGVTCLLYWVASKVGRWELCWKWKKAFMANNADLHLNLTAIGMVVFHMRVSTAYRGVNFQSVATAIAIALRKKDPCESLGVSRFAYEAIHAYLYYSDNKGELLPTACPRRE